MADPKVNLNDPHNLRDKNDFLRKKGITTDSLTKLQKLLSDGKNFRTRNDLIPFLPPEQIDIIISHGGFFPPPVRVTAQAVINFDPANTQGFTLVLSNPSTGRYFKEFIAIDRSPVVWRYFVDEVPNSFHVAVKGPDGAFSKLVEPRTNKEVDEIQYTLKEFNGTTIKFVSVPLLEGKERKEIPFNYTGKVISQSGNAKLVDISIVIYVSTVEDPDETDHFPLCYAITESNGYFVTSEALYQSPTQYLELTSAFAILDVEEKIKQTIRLVPTKNKKLKLPEKIILVIDGKESSQDDDCGCNELNFLKKRVLDEFNYQTVIRTSEPTIEAYNITEPYEISAEDLLDKKDLPILDKFPGLKFPHDIVSQFLEKEKKVTSNNIGKLIDLANIRKVDLALGKNYIQKGRVYLDGKTSIDWDNEPTIYQATSVAHGHLLHFKQEWFNGGYSIGDILYSLPIPPGHRKQIAVFDWDRRESASNTQQVDFEESLYNSLSRDRDVNEIAKSLVKESIDGHSDATNAGAAAGGAVGAMGVIPAGDVPIPAGGLVGAAGGISHSDANSSQDSSRRATASSFQKLHDKTVQAANNVRSQRSTVIQTVSQGERFSSSSEVIANYNHCHAMTIEYFEVLRHFEIVTKLVEVQECLFVPLRLTPFNADKALRWREPLARFLRRRHLLPAFNAIERIENAKDFNDGVDKYYDSIGVPNVRYGEEAIEYVEGNLVVEIDIRRPNDDDKGEFLPEAWNPLAPFLGILPREFYERFIEKQKNKDESFLKNAGYRIAEEFVKNLQIIAHRNSGIILNSKLPIDASLVSEFKNQSRLSISLRMQGAMPSLIRQDVDYITIRLKPDSSSLSSILGKNLNIIVKSGSLRYRTKNLSEYLFRDLNINNDISASGDTVQVATPLSKEALRNPRQEDINLYNALIKHLNDNIEYYHKCIWMSMSPERRYLLLDGVIAPNSGDRSVASVVENTLIGIVGNCLVMPVSAGISLDPRWNKEKNLFEHYYLEPEEPTHLSLPTKGVYAEALLGKCNSCEKIEEDRFWRWNEVPLPDALPAINPITPPIPQVNEPDLQPKDFPPSLINIQNAPDAPAPQGFGSLVQLLSNPNLFRDATGLSETQKSALATLQRAFQSSEFFGEQAKQLTLAAGQNAQALEQISKARKNNLIDGDKAKESSGKAIDSIVKSSEGTGSSASTAIKDIESLSGLHDKNLISDKEFEEWKEALRDRYVREIERTIDSKEIREKIKESERVEVETPQKKIKIETSPNIGTSKTDVIISATFEDFNGRFFDYNAIAGTEIQTSIFGQGKKLIDTLPQRMESSGPRPFRTTFKDLLIEHDVRYEIDLLVLEGDVAVFQGSASVLFPRNQTSVKLTAKIRTDEPIPLKIGIHADVEAALHAKIGGKFTAGVEAALIEILKVIVQRELSIELGTDITLGIGGDAEATINIRLPNNGLTISVE
jgi:hypothetical protein